MKIDLSATKDQNRFAPEIHYLKAAVAVAVAVVAAAMTTLPPSVLATTASVVLVDRESMNVRELGE